jgi:charged multivesicular body protein 4
VSGNREKIREQNALSDEIVNAITSNAIGETMDENELEAELDLLLQKQLDEKMLNTGTVPVADEVHKIPMVANGEREFFDPHHLLPPTEAYNSFGDICGRYGRRANRDVNIVKGKAPAVAEDDEEEELRKLQAEMAM